MAHFARVQGGIVIDVHAVNNAVITNAEGVEVEALGQAFLSELWGGDPVDYVQCSYNGTFRGAYPGVGYTFDGVDFIPPAAPEVTP